MSEQQEQDITEPVESTEPADPVETGSTADEPVGESTEEAGEVSGETEAPEGFSLDDEDFDAPIPLGNGKTITLREVQRNLEWWETNGDAKSLRDLHLKKSDDWSKKEKTHGELSEKVQEYETRLKGVAEHLYSRPLDFAVEAAQIGMAQGHDPAEAMRAIVDVAVRNRVFHPNALMAFDQFVSAMQEGAGYDPRYFQQAQAQYQGQRAQQLVQSQQQEHRANQTVWSFQEQIGKVLSGTEKAALQAELRTLAQAGWAGSDMDALSLAWKQVQAKQAPQAPQAQQGTSKPSSSAVAKPTIGTKLKQLRRSGEAGGLAGKETAANLPDAMTLARRVIASRGR